MRPVLTRAAGWLLAGEGAERCRGCSNADMRSSVPAALSGGKCSSAGRLSGFGGRSLGAWLGSGAEVARVGVVGAGGASGLRSVVSVKPRSTARQSSGRQRNDGRGASHGSGGSDGGGDRPCWIRVSSSWATRACAPRAFQGGGGKWGTAGGAHLGHGSPCAGVDKHLLQLGHAALGGHREGTDVYRRRQLQLQIQLRRHA